MATHGFRSFPPPVQRFFIATVVNMVGTAAMFGFVLIYFEEVRGLTSGQAGIAVGASSLVTVAVTPIAGSLADRLGARRVLTLGCLVCIVAGGSYAVVDSFVTALAVSTLLGIGNGLWFPSQSALISLIMTPEQRPTASAFQRFAFNLGAALGGLIGGLIVANETLASFRVLFAINVGTYLMFLTVIPGLPSRRIEQADHVEGQSVGFRKVLEDRFFVKVVGTDVAVALGFGFLFAVTPSYASKLGVGNGTIGVIFAIGAVAVVVTQLWTLRWAHGKRRMESLALMNAWFAVAFALMLLTPHTSVAIAIAIMCAAQVLGGFGESILGAIRVPLTSDLAPEDVVGRYFGLAGMTFQASMGLATAVGGMLMQWSLTSVWALPLIAALGGMAGTWALRHQVPEHAARNV